MAKLYFKLILQGRMTIDDVPKRWRDEVQKMLDDYYAQYPNGTKDGRM